MFEGGCGLANCCKNKQTGERQLVTNWDEIIKPYDATQEPIFPPELQVSFNFYYSEFPMQ